MQAGSEGHVDQHAQCQPGAGRQPQGHGEAEDSDPVCRWRKEDPGRTDAGKGSKEGAWFTQHRWARRHRPRGGEAVSEQNTSPRTSWL